MKLCNCDKMLIFVAIICFFAICFWIILNILVILSIRLYNYYITRRRIFILHNHHPPNTPITTNHINTNDNYTLNNLYFTNINSSSFAHSEPRPNSSNNNNDIKLQII